MREAISIAMLIFKQSMLLLGLEPTVLIFIAAVLFASAAIQGMTGFGFALVNVPLLLFVLPVPVVVVLNTLLALGLNGGLFWQTRQHLTRAQFGRAGFLIPAYYMVGASLGTYLLLALSEGVLKGLVYGAMIVFALLIWRGARVQVHHERPVAAAVGFSSGLIGSTTSMGGPPIVLYLAARGYTKEVFRAVLGMYGFGLVALQLVIYALGGVVTREIVVLTLGLSLAVLLGYMLGMRLFHTVSQEAFRRLVLLVVLGTAVAGLAGLFFMA